MGNSATKNTAFRRAAGLTGALAIFFQSTFLYSKPLDDKTKYLNWIDPNFVNYQGAKQNPEGGVGAGAAGLGAGIGSGNSDGSKNGTNNAINRLLNNDGAGKGSGGAGDSGSGSGTGSDTDNPGGRGGLPPAGGGTSGGAPGGSQAFDKWFPMCMFIDPSIPNPNAIVKGIVDMAAACKVNLEIFPVTIKGNYPNSPDAVNALQKKSCDLKNIFPEISDFPTQTIVKYPLMAAEMCNAKDPTDPQQQRWDPGVAGCAELRGGEGIDFAKANAKAGGYGGSGTSSGAIPSIVVPQGANAGVAMHEAGGHSWMGWPNHDGPPKTEDVGLGIGKPTSKFNARLDNVIDQLYQLAGRPPLPHHDDDFLIVAAAEGGSLKGTFNGTGCAQLAGRSYKNDGSHRYDASQTDYFEHQFDYKRQLQLGEPLFGPGRPASPPGPPVFFGGDPRPPATDEKLVFDESAKKEDLPQLPKIDPTPGATRHKKKLSDLLLKAATEENARPEAEDSDDSMDLNDESTYGSSPKGGGGSSSRLTFDEGVKKGGESQGTSVSGGSSGSTITAKGNEGSSAGKSEEKDGAESGDNSEGSGDSAGLKFDESASKTGIGDTGTSVRGGVRPNSPGGKTGLGGNAVKSANKKSDDSELDDGFFKKTAGKPAAATRRVKGSSLRSNQDREPAAAPIPTFKP